MTIVSERFRSQAARTPDAVALLFRDGHLTYAALDDRAERFASVLMSRGIGGGAIVAVRMRQSFDLVVALLGVARCGAAYVGIDPAWPLARAREVLRLAAAHALIVDRGEAHVLVFAGDIVEPSAAIVPGTGSTGEAVRHAGATDDVFSILYTSGSTGSPKGVLVTCASVIHKLEWMWSTYPFEPGDVVFLHRSHTTVGFAWDCFAGLLRGVPTVMQPGEDARDVNMSIAAAQRAAVTLCAGSVGFWTAAVDCAERQADFWPALRLARVSGEALPPGLVARWRRVFPRARLLNIYGATECSGSTAYDTAAFDVTAKRVSIGWPIPGVEVFVVDEQMQSVGVGEIGELCVGGASLAQGYFADRPGTTQRFVTPLFEVAGGRVFRTGDLAVMRADGALEIIGRRDLQVKVRGHRVEIEEVEAALLECAGVRAAAVCAEADERGDTRLIAFVASNDIPPVTASSLRSMLGDAVPSYMVPAEFVAVDSVPRMANGKIDRVAVAALRASTVKAPGDVVPPTTPTETAVAEVWTDVLRVRSASRHDNFFDMGGHSLTAFEIVSRLERAFAIAIPARVLFDNPSIGTLATAIDSLVAAGQRAPRSGAAAFRASTRQP